MAINSIKQLKQSLGLKIFFGLAVCSTAVALIIFFILQMGLYFVKMILDLHGFAIVVNLLDDAVCFTVKM